MIYQINDNEMIDLKCVSGVKCPELYTYVGKWLFKVYIDSREYYSKKYDTKEEVEAQFNEFMNFWKSAV